MNMAWWETTYVRKPHVRMLTYVFSLTLCGVYWTFYVPSTIAAGHGWNFIEVFLSPVLGMTLLFPFLRRIVRVARRENIGSLADFLAMRYGKSKTIGVLVTVVASVAMTFFIAQQLKTLSTGWNAIVGSFLPPLTVPVYILLSCLLVVLSVFVGARRPTFTHHNLDLMNMAAADGALKLAAICLIAIPCAVFLGTHVGAVSVARLAPLRLDGGFFMTIFLLGGAVLCVPHVFHLAVVEAEREEDLRSAQKILPLYFAVAFVAFLLVTWTGSTIAGLDPQSYVLGTARVLVGPLAAVGLFILSLFTAATLVAAATFSVATMVSDQISLSALMQSRRRNSSAINVGRDIMHIRRGAIAVAVATGCLFAYMMDSQVSSTIGLLFGSLIVQLLPSLIAAIRWRRAHRFGAIAGILGGCSIWLLCIGAPLLTHTRMTSWLSFALAVSPPTDVFVQRCIASMLVNMALLVAVSLWARPRLIDRIQAAAFIDAEVSQMRRDMPAANRVSIANLKTLLDQFLGEQDAAVAIGELEVKYKRTLSEQDAIDADIARDAELKLAGVVGASLASSLLRWQLSHPDMHSPEFVHFLEQTAQAIRLNREMLQATLNNLSQGVCVVDRDFKLVAWNARYLEIFDLAPGTLSPGLSLAEIIRRNRSRSGYSEENTEQYIRRRLRDVRLGIPHVFERKWSTGKTLQVFGLPMSDGRYVTSFTDVTSVQNVVADLRQANQRLEERVRLRTAELTQANEALKRSTLQAERARASQARFLAAASHDLLQPLHAARLFLGALQEQARGSAGISELANNADVSIETANRLLNALLNLSRLEVGGLRPEVRPVDVDHLFSDLRREFVPLARSRGLNLRIVPTRLWVESDEDLLRSILQNLIGNAVRYTEEGAVLVTCRRRAGEILFAVRDSGPGIADESLENIFQEYVRLPQGRDVGKGLGLGLSIVRRICDVLHHRVSVRSWLGKGTTFEVAAPLAQKLHKAADAPPRAIASLAGLAVLCVEDDATVRGSLESLLKRWEVTARFVGSVRQALDIPEQWDVVLTDYHFDSGQNGLDLVEKMQGRARAFALITADAGADVLARAAELGAGVIRKPLAPAMLRTFLARVRLLKSEVD